MVVEAPKHVGEYAIEQDFAAMPSTNIPYRLVLRIQHANDDAFLRADIEEAAKRQKSLARDSPYHRYGRTLTGCADPSTPRRRVKQNLDNVKRSGRTNGPVLARYGDHTFNRTSAVAGRGRAFKRTALKYEAEATEEAPLVLQSKKLKRDKHCKKKKLGAKNRQDEGQSTPADDTLTSTTQVKESRNQLSCVPTTSSAPPASHHPTSGSFVSLSPANNVSNEDLDNETPSQANSRNGDDPIDSRGKKFVDHFGPAYHEDLIGPAMLGIMGERPMVDDTSWGWLSEEARKDWYSLETPTEPLTAVDGVYRPVVTLQQQLADEPGHAPDLPPSRDKRARPSLMTFGRNIKRNVMRRLHQKHEIPCGEPRHEKLRSVQAWLEPVVNTNSIPTENSVTTTKVDGGRYAIGSPCNPAELAGDDSIYQHLARLAMQARAVVEAADGTRCIMGGETSQSTQSAARHPPRSGKLEAQETDSKQPECYDIGVQQGSVDSLSLSPQSVARHPPRSGSLEAQEVNSKQPERYVIGVQQGSVDNRDQPLYSSSMCTDDEHDPNGLAHSHIPRWSSFRTKNELCRHLRPDPAELPAYEQVMRKDTNKPAVVSLVGNGTLGASDQGSSGSSGRALTKPEDIWLYTPRSCTTCADFGLLPLHYCAQCKKLRVDMCSECYSMGHNTCQQAGHDVLETGRMQDIPNQKSKTTSDPGSSSDSAIRKCTEVVPSHILDKFLTFVAEERSYLREERSYMRDELKRARSYTAVCQQMAVDDRVEARASRTVKLDALPASATKEEERKVLETQKSLSSVKDVSHLLHDSGDTDASQANANPPIQIPESLQQGSLERKWTTLGGTIPNRPDSCLSHDLPKDLLSPDFSPTSQGPQKELSDMDSELQRNERLQSFRERIIALREKEVELRERESAVELNEKRLLAPEHLNTPPREMGHSSVSRITTSLTSEPKCQPGPVKASLPAPGSISKHSCLNSEFNSPCSTLSMSHYESAACTSSPSGSTAAPAKDGFHISPVLIKQLLSNFFLRRTRKGIRTRTGKRARQDDSLQHTKGSSKVEPSSSCTPRKRARKGVLARRHSERSDRSGTDSDSNKRCKKTASTKAISGRLLACPYAKFDPFRYSSSNQDESDYRRCSTHCLRDIPRLK